MENSFAIAPSTPGLPPCAATHTTRDASSLATPEAGVRVIAIEGTRRRNALDLEAFLALAAAWADLEQAGHVRVGVVTGNGADFCSGADLSSIASGITRAVRGEHSAASVWAGIHAAVLRGTPR